VNCSALQCVAVCWCVAMCCSTVQYVAVLCNVSEYSLPPVTHDKIKSNVRVDYVTHRDVLQCVGVLQCVAVRCNVLQFCQM